MNSQDKTNNKLKIELKELQNKYDSLLESLNTITNEKKQVEEALKESQLLYNSFIEQLPNAVFRKDLEGRYVLVNSQFCKLKGLNREDLIGKTPIEVASREIAILGEQGHATKYANIGEDIHTKILRTGKFFETEEEYPNETLGKQYLQVIRMPIFDSYGTIIGTQGIMFDITGRKQALEKLKSNESALKRHIADKDRFISILAHDLKSPFGSILGFLELILGNFHKYNIEKIKKHINIIHYSAKNTYNLLEDLLMWACSQSGKIPYEPKNVSFTEIYEEVINNIKLSADNKNISINYSTTDEIFIYADTEMLKTILRNLISNAVKFTCNGGRIVICTQSTQSNVTISVSDNGIGIDPEIMEHLFDIAMVHSTEGTAKEKGTGLGLVLCKEFVEKHGGKIWVESNLQNEDAESGTTFYFTIPGAN